MVALEQTGLRYADSLVKLMDGQQRAPEYLAINPKGKVPALRVGDTVLTETPVIVDYLDRLAPRAGLLPHTEDPAAHAKNLADVFWASSTLHTGVLRQIIAPFRLTDGDPSAVKIKGLAMLEELAGSIGERIMAGGWWFADDWSIMDVYISWIFTTAHIGGFELGRFPVLLAHDERVRGQPAFQRVLARERAVLDGAGIRLPTAPPPR